MSSRKKDKNSKKNKDKYVKDYDEDNYEDKNKSKSKSKSKSKNKEDEIRSLPTLDYIQLTVQKEVQQGLLEVARKKPKKPIKFLGEYLVQKSKNTV